MDIKGLYEERRKRQIEMIKSELLYARNYAKEYRRQIAERKEELRRAKMAGGNEREIEAIEKLGWRYGGHKYGNQFLWKHWTEEVGGPTFDADVLLESDAGIAYLADVGMIHPKTGEKIKTQMGFYYVPTGMRETAKICLGNAAAKVSEAVKRGRFLEATEMVMAVIRRPPGPSDGPYWRTTQFMALVQCTAKGPLSGEECKTIYSADVVSMCRRCGHIGRVGLFSEKLTRKGRMTKAVGALLDAKVIWAETALKLEELTGGNGTTTDRFRFTNTLQPFMCVGCRNPIEVGEQMYISGPRGNRNCSHLKCPNYVCEMMPPDGAMCLRMLSQERYRTIGTFRCDQH